MASTEDKENITAIIRKLMDDFNRLRLERHNMGEQKYGPFTYLGNDIVRMMIEELADVANYVEYQAAKLLLLQALLEEDPRLEQWTKEGSISIGVESFRGTGEGWRPSS